MSRHDQPVRGLAEIGRLRQVASVLADEGLAWFLSDLRLRYLDPLSARWRRLWRRPRADVRRLPPEARLRRALERLGPTYIKFGQILSTRPDLLPAEYVDELAKLQDNVQPVPASEIRREIEKELGRPVAELFRRFDDRPWAAASLAQVHRAELSDGVTVAVKVRRPGVDHLVRTDIRILMFLAAQMERRLPWSRRFQPVKLAREFADWTLRELDFEREAANIAKFGELFGEDEPDLVLPVVRWSLTTPGVLTAELIEGIRLDDQESLEKAGIDRPALARLGLRIGFKQFLIHGFFHADPHPGNLTALPPAQPDGQPRLGMYDFGMVGQLSEKTRYELAGCFLAFGRKDDQAYVRHIIDLAESTEGADLNAFAKEASALLTGVLWKPTDHKRLGQAFYEVLISAARSGLVFSRELVLVGKAMLTLENIGLALYPTIDLDEEIKPFLGELYRQELDPRRLAKDASGAALDVLYSLKHFPEDAQAVLDRLARGQIGVRLDLEELRDLKLEFDRENDIRVTAIIASATLLASALALSVGGTAARFGQLGFVLSLIMVGWTLVRVSRQPRL